MEPNTVSCRVLTSVTALTARTPLVTGRAPALPRPSPRRRTTERSPSLAARARIRRKLPDPTSGADIQVQDGTGIHRNPAFEATETQCAKMLPRVVSDYNHSQQPTRTRDDLGGHIPKQIP